VVICERCVDLADEVLVERVQRSNRWTRLAVETEPGATCSLCCKQRRDVPGLVLAPDRPAVGKFGRHGQAGRLARVRICSECLALCGEIGAEQPV